MSTTVTGRLVDENSQPYSAPLLVRISDESALFDRDLASDKSNSSGQFSITIMEDAFPEMGTRTLGIKVTTVPIGRLLHTSTHDDVTTATLALGDITIKQADATGWTVTLLGSSNALPVREGNAILPLVDDQLAWSHVQSVIANARSSLSLMQLDFDIPHTYVAAPDQERPEVVLSFGSPLDASNLRKALNPDDYRPERMFIDSAGKGTSARILISTNAMLNFLVGVKNFFSPGPMGREVEVSSYFTAGGGTTKVAPFNTTWFNVMHSKMLLIDDNQALLLGSPFAQCYWDTPAHPVFEPRRGSAAGESAPVHDVSIGVRGAAVKDAHDAYALHWNRDAAAADKIPDTIAAPDPITAPANGEILAALQFVRTINVGAFTAMPDGELGVLEAYLRAIENARDFIYFENQYFTNDAITAALIGALNDTTNRPNLQVILLLNIRPDMPSYPGWQGKRVAEIRTRAGKNAARFGVFNAWTHDPPMPSRNQNKPMIMPNYLHTKVAVVDGKWATIGSANLDGASLDVYQSFQYLHFGPARNHEANYLIFNAIDGHPATTAVDSIRQTLWGEHLGIPANDPRLANPPASGGWLSLWMTTAAAKLAALLADPADINIARGRVLAWPDTVKPGASYKQVLDLLKIDFTKVDFVESTTAFSFAKGTWS